MRKSALFGAAFGLAVIIGGAGANAAGPPTPIKPGKYHCIAGSSRMMLTLGDMTVTGMKYSFKTPTGEVNTGAYSMTPTGYHWSGDISAIKNDQIVDSGPDSTPGDFWFSYKARPTSLPTSVSCAHV